MKITIKTLMAWLVGLGLVWLIIIIICVIYAKVDFLSRKGKLREGIYGDGIGIESRFSFSSEGKIILFDAVTDSEIIMKEFGGPRGLVVPDIKKSGERNVYTIDLGNSHISKLTSAGNNAFATFSPDGKKIAFISDRDGNDEIYIMNADGSEQKRLTNNSFIDYPPSFSPNGSQLVFTRLTQNPRNLYFGADIHRLIILALSDGQEYEVAQSEENFYSKTPEFITNTNILFKKEVLTLGFDANKFLVIFKSEPNSDIRKAIDAGYIVSPDGKKAAFTRRTSKDPYKTVLEVFIADIDGKNRSQITNNSRCNYIKVFSPDSQKILFISGPDSGEAIDLELWEVNVDGSDLRRMNINLG